MAKNVVPKNIIESFADGIGNRAEGGGIIMRGVKKVGGWISGGANKVAYGIGRSGLHIPLIGGAVIAGIGGLAWWAHSSRKEAERASREALHDEAMAAAQMPSVNSNTMMGLDPVQGVHAQRVLAARGVGAQPGVDTSQPALTVGAPVQQLGA